MDPHARAGVGFATLAFAMWGLMPLYFRQLASVAPVEIVLHRSIWSLAFVLGVLAVLRRWTWWSVLGPPRRQVAGHLASATLLAGNWLLYVWALQRGQVVEAGLGYFINPLVNVLLGVTVLRERLRLAQWLAVALAACGVAWLTWHTGRLPWVALLLAISFGLYGLLRKTSQQGPLEGLALETLLLAPLMLPALLAWTFMQDGVFVRHDIALTGWTLLAGPLTARPVLFFAAGARRLPLAMVGLVQYLSPSIHLVLGVWAFGEAFGPVQLVGFGLIWAALALVSADALGWLTARGRRPGSPGSRPRG